MPRCHPCSSSPTYDVDTSSLEKRYKLLQWQLHPDKAVGKTPEEKAFSAEQAALVNQAYGVLRAPLPRANYLVRSQHGAAAPNRSADVRMRACARGLRGLCVQQAARERRSTAEPPCC